MTEQEKKFRVAVQPRIRGELLVLEATLEGTDSPSIEVMVMSLPLLRAVEGSKTVDAEAVAEVINQLSHILGVGLGRIISGEDPLKVESQLSDLTKQAAARRN